MLCSYYSLRKKLVIMTSSINQIEHDIQITISVINTDTTNIDELQSVQKLKSEYFRNNFC